ncbi:DNA polymerase zeta processivity subunit isoform X2 [Salvia miltiorrhiza]|uniref:DNA polymerase zeta processivity subunit isoform X2 n=1 Tax=Salvia miltiorrhiza TaxID=226208 RepID=UPI0025ABFB9D|nr:DNA polymerase zeta processivity subunit isoform X2 [Salvia miltiorrhiza]
MERKDNQTPQGEIARILVEFLEVAITSVVFLKGVYPNGAFERRRYMNLVVHKARHPQLYEYIHVAVNGLLAFLTKDLIDRVAVVFLDDGGLPIERFVFKLNVNQSYSSKVQQADLEFSLRSFLIKLPLSEPLTKILPPNCRWEIMAYFRALPQASTSKDAEMWIPSDAKQWQQPAVITPIKSMSSEPLRVQVYAEDPNPSAPKN